MNERAKCRIGQGHAELSDERAFRQSLECLAREVHYGLARILLNRELGGSCDFVESEDI